MRWRPICRIASVRATRAGSRAICGGATMAATIGTGIPPSCGWARIPKRKSRRRTGWIAPRALTLPVLLIRGGRSRIVSPEGARDFLAMVPQARFVDIANADHMVAGDANDAFNAAVLAFIDDEARAAA